MNALGMIENFGTVDAEEDPYLSECFETHEAFLAARNQSRFLVLGRKGSGKSAVYRKILELASHDLFAHGFEFSDYPWYYHDRLGTSGVPEEERYVASWKYFSLLMTARVLINEDESQPWRPEAQEGIGKLRDFVESVYGTANPEPKRVFDQDKLGRLKFSATYAGTGLAVEGAKAEAGRPIPFSDINRYLTDIVVDCLNPDHQYFLCFDQLDRGFDYSDDYKQRLVGVLIAARDLNIAVRRTNKRLSVLVFLRDDIYQILSFEDKNKLTDNYSTVIGWSGANETLGTKTLRQLMNKRFAKLLDLPEERAWTVVFDESAVMTGNQTKYQHIVDRTFLRPRDIIKFCNEVLSAYKARGASGSFENRDVEAARPRYSQYLLNELDDEVAKHIPNYRSYLALLSAVGKANFSRDEFDEAYEARKTQFKEVDGETATYVLRSLFEFSVIGYYSPGRGAGGEYVWRYQNPRVQFDDAAPFFRIHYGFIEGLDLKRFSRRRKAV